MDIAKLIVGILHILLSIIIIALILLQSGKQAGLSGAIAGASETFFGKNKSRTMDAILGRFTKICAIGFLLTSLFLAYGDIYTDRINGTDTNGTDTQQTLPLEGLPSDDGQVPLEGVPGDEGTGASASDVPNDDANAPADVPTESVNP